MKSKNTPTPAQAGAFIALSCVSFIASSPALAQANPTRLEGVTVSDSAIDGAYKTETLTNPRFTAPILDTPRTVQVITEKVLEDSAIFSMEEAMRTVPGITIGAGEGGTASADIPLIRGVDATGDVFVDGLRDVGSQTREIFALESIEISKGPSSALGGRGAAAGSINLVSKVARQGTFASAQITGGTDDLLRLVGDVNVQLADDFSARVVGMYHQSDVPGRDSVYSDRWGVAPSITYGAGGPVTVSLDYYHLTTDQIPDYGIPLTSREQLPDDMRRPVDVDYNNFYGLLSRDFQKTEVDAVTFHFAAELAEGITLSNATRRSSTKNDYIVTNPDDSAGNVANGLVWRNVKSRNSQADGIATNTNLSADVKTGNIAHSLAVGIDYNQTTSTNRAYNVATGDRACTPADLAAFNCTSLNNPDPADPWDGAISVSNDPARASAKELSVYLFDTITITPQLLLNGGLRWSDFSATGSGNTRGTPYSAAAKNNFWSWQGGAVFKPTPATSLYISYADAKTPPGTTVGEGSEDISGTNQFYEPSRTENWEAGAKAEVLNGALLLSAAAFRVERDNIQQRDPSGEVTEILNKARIQGFEVSAAGSAGPVSLLLGYTYLDSELRDSSVNDGNYLPQTPEHNFAATVDLQITPQLSIGGGAHAASKRYADAANLVSADGYIAFDAHAQYDLNDNFGVRLNVNNIGDRRYIAKLRNPHFAVPSEGRRALISLVARY